MTYTTQDLYELLPAIYRIRDAELDFSLRRLVGVLAEQAEVMDQQIAQLYQDWFIETCERWVVPYIGDLLRVGVLAASALDSPSKLPVLPRAFSQRSYVANTIRYRRRKGTPGVLEQIAYDVSGWPAKVVEYFQRLSTTQYVKHPRPANLATPDLRNGSALDLIEGPFDLTTRTAEVRPFISPSSRAAPLTPLDLGRYNIPNVGVSVYRLQAYPVSGASARLATDPAGAGFTFSPLGLNTQLFNPPRTEVEISHLAEELDLPVRLRRRGLFDEVEGLRQAAVDGRAGVAAFLGGPNPVFRIGYRLNGETTFTPVSPDQMVICDLSIYRRPAATRSYRPTRGGPEQSMPIVVGVDPELGRLAFAEGTDAAAVEVSYSYGFSGDMGGGPYDRQDAFSTWLEQSELTFIRGVTQRQATEAEAFDPTLLFSNLKEAVAEWNAAVASAPTGSHPFGLIVVMDSGTYDEALTGSFTIDIPAGARLAIAAAGWPQQIPDASDPVRVLALGELLRPHIRGDISVAGSASVSDVNPGELILQGLLIEGSVTVVAGNLGRLRLVDSTVGPRVGSLAVQTLSMSQGNAALHVWLERSICGPVDLPDPVPNFHAYDSILDGAGAGAVTAPVAAADLQRCTIWGAVQVRKLEASDVLFVDPVTATRTQEGCVRFSHVPAGSSTPRRFRCQPDLALKGAKGAAQKARIRAEMRPDFVSETYGEPTYAQLGLTLPSGIRAGGSNEAEIGGFNTLLQPQREADLRTALADYLRFGLEAGVDFVT